jgi:hypothetical protein
MMYSSSYGLWYDPRKQMYMDANTGSWYRLDADGHYEAVPEAGFGFEQEPSSQAEQQQQQQEGQQGSAAQMT